MGRDPRLLAAGKLALRLLQRLQQLCRRWRRPARRRPALRTLVQLLRAVARAGQLGFHRRHLLLLRFGDLLQPRTYGDSLPSARPLLACTLCSASRFV